MKEDVIMNECLVKEKTVSEYLESREYAEEITKERSNYIHDRDRLIHSRAFRRMMHKTQIFNANKGDHYRNRLTHTLEVMQIARSIARRLELNEDLTEAIALGHDIGHTPFGHVGERTLNDIMMNGLEGYIPPTKQGFKHNYQSVRIAERLESRRDEYTGMNLTLAVREGIIKHTKIFKKETHELFVYYPKDLNLVGMRMDLPHSITLEGQIVAMADEIAQITHDIEDGCRSKIIGFNDFVSQSLVKEYIKSSNIKEESNYSYNMQDRIIKGLVGYLIEDVVKESKNLIEDYNKTKQPEFNNEQDVYTKQCIKYSATISKKATDLAKMKDSCIIYSKEISQSDSKAEFIIKQIFKAYYKHPKELPDYIFQRYYGLKSMSGIKRKDIIDKNLQADPYFIRCICDHIAGMTDQFAAREYNSLYVPEFV